MGELRVSEIVGEEREGGRGGGGKGEESYSGKLLLAEEVVVRYWRVESSRHGIYIELAGGGGASESCDGVDVGTGGRLARAAQPPSTPPPTRHKSPIQT